MRAKETRERECPAEEEEWRNEGEQETGFGGAFVCIGGFVYDDGVAVTLIY